MANPATWQLMYSNFYKPGSPRFAYPVSRRAYMTRKAYQGNCTEARSGSFCNDNVGARCYKIGADNYNCAGSESDKGFTDEQIKQRAGLHGPNTGGFSGGGGGFGLDSITKMFSDNPLLIAAVVGGIALVVVIAVM